MTTVYFIRHAESDISVHDNRVRPLTEKGMNDRALVTAFLQDKNIDVVLSSPYKRAVDTVADFAEKNSLEIELIEDFREHKISSVWIDDWKAHVIKLWDDFSYKLSDGECLAEIQQRNIAALNEVLKRYKDKNIVIGTHGMALSTIINYYDKTYGFDNLMSMVYIQPWVVRMNFNGNDCAGMEKIDLFNPIKQKDYNNCIVGVSALGTLKAYRFVVIFARYKDKWLYCRAKERDCFETPGGHIEQSETTLEAAKRELFEETGAVKFDIEPAFDYSVRIATEISNGQVFFAQIHELGKIPDYEMAEVKLFDTIPDKMRFPKILPVLYDKMQHWVML
ncbi:MAG: histidine phosphatase family protein [Oscillospiraceae bacterium]|nr:histidine phosphatase family protein [Oscillospiraceae bacterium]